MSSKSKKSQDANKALKKVYQMVCRELDLPRQDRRLVCALLNESRSIDLGVLGSKSSNLVSNLVDMRASYQTDSLELELVATPYEAAIDALNESMVKFIVEQPELGQLRDEICCKYDNDMSMFDPLLTSEIQTITKIRGWVTSATLDFDGNVVDQLPWPKARKSSLLTSLKEVMRDRNRLLKKNRNWSLKHLPPIVDTHYYPHDPNSHLEPEVRRILDSILTARQRLAGKLGLPPKGSGRRNETLRFVICACMFVLKDECPPENKIENYSHRWRRSYKEMFEWPDEKNEKSKS
ncbi:MAG: hypothetical protein ABJH63_13115 [Rhizobiaceae bacterium]